MTPTLDWQRRNENKQQDVTRSLPMINHHAEPQYDSICKPATLCFVKPFCSEWFTPFKLTWCFIWNQCSGWLQQHKTIVYKLSLNDWINEITAEAPGTCKSFCGVYKLQRYSCLCWLSLFMADIQQAPVHLFPLPLWKRLLLKVMSRCCDIVEWYAGGRQEVISCSKNDTSHWKSAAFSD